MANLSTPPTLVVLQLTGGNDPLNTVIPYGDPLYYDNRPTIRIAEEDVLRIDNHYGFHPSMAAIKPFWDAGKMAILAGVGYPNVDYSHFRSMDIWYTCEPETMATDGWLGKVVREMDPKADNVLTAVNFGRGLPRAFTLDGVPVASVAELDNYGLLTGLASVAERQSALDVFSCMYDDGWNDQGHRPVKLRQPGESIGDVLRYMGRTGLDAQKGADILRTAVDGYSSTVAYPSTSIASSLKGIAQVKFAGLGTRVFYCATGSFDTHANQLKVHGQLWQEVSEAVAAFFADLREHQASEDVIMLLWTEFGRRARDNGAGTDHGAGGHAFVIGDRVKGGFYGEYPSLKESDLTLGNLKYGIDFRSAYSSILERWLDIEAKPIVGGTFEQIAFV